MHRRSTVTKSPVNPHDIQGVGRHRIREGVAIRWSQRRIAAPMMKKAADVPRRVSLGPEYVLDSIIVGICGHPLSRLETRRCGPRQILVEGLRERNREVRFGTAERVLLLRVADVQQTVGCAISRLISRIIWGKYYQST